MKRLISFAMVFVLAAMLLAGCGGKKPALSNEPQQEANNEDTANQNSSPEKSSEDENKDSSSNAKGGIYKVAGMELLDYYNAFNGGLEAFSKAINSIDTSDFELINVEMDYMMPAQFVVAMTMFDFLEDGDKEREEGKNGKYDAVREKNGDIITFKQSMTREEDGYGETAKKGDIESLSGTLNTSTNTLYVEAKTERNGEVISRNVTEVVMIGDGAFIAQSFDKPQKPTDKRLEDKGSSYFVRFDKKELEAVAAKFPPDVNFTFNSIAGKNDITPEVMAEGHTKLRQLIVKDGTATAKKY